MKASRLALLLWCLLMAGAPGKERVFVLTDISNEPDDEQSLVRFLVYANEYDIEGLVATTSQHLRDRTRLDLIRRQIEAYGTVRDNLEVHGDGFPSKARLLSIATTGQPGFNMEAVGDGKSTNGSKLLLAAADRDDPRPLWISVWGGANTLAQALWDARKERSPEDLAKLITKLRVYTISDQDDAGAWLRKEFPRLFYIVTPSRSWKEYYRATWTGISGDKHYKNGPCYHFELVANPWLEKNIINDHGPLGALYPKLTYIMEGDTPSFLGLIENGLAWSASPDFGGWGGRYKLYKSYAESRPIWTNNHDSRDTVTIDGKSYTSDQATIWRWRKHFQHDFAARMDWCVAGEYAKANHNPIAILNGDRWKKFVEVKAKQGETITLSAKGSNDPDKNAVATRWMIYREAGTHGGPVNLSATEGEETKVTIGPGRPLKEPATVHVILTVEDDGNPSLVAYRRAVITVTK